MSKIANIVLALGCKNSYCFTDINPNLKSQEVTMPIQEGKAAPAFSLPDAYGNKVALKDFKGKNVIVYFYPKDDTPG